jgi:hypothetical protein
MRHRYGSSPSQRTLRQLSWCWKQISTYSHIVYSHKTLWHESASELHRPSNLSVSGELVPTFADRGCRGKRDGSLRPYSRFSRPEPILSISSSSSIVLTRLSGPSSRLTISQRIEYSREPNTDIRICSQKLWPQDHRGKNRRKDIPETGRGGPQSCEMLRIQHCLDNRLTVNCEILATCSSTYSPVRTSQEARSVSIK